MLGKVISKEKKALLSINRYRVSIGYNYQLSKAKVSNHKYWIELDYASNVFDLDY